MAKELTENNLRKLRKTHSIPQWKLGLYANMQQSRISLLEQGAPPRADEKEKLANALEVEPEQIWPVENEGK